MESEIALRKSVPSYVDKLKDLSINERQEGSLEVEVHQVIKDLQDNLVFDGTVKHVYTFENGLIKV